MPLTPEERQRFMTVEQYGRLLQVAIIASAISFLLGIAVGYHAGSTGP